MVSAPLLPSILKIDCEKEVKKITTALKQSLMTFRRRGYVVAISGGIDSSVTLGLCVQAVGPDKVVGIQMPERHSAEETLGLSAIVADAFNVKRYLEDITGVLEAVGFYRRYDDCVASVIPEYGKGWKSKIVVPSVVTHDGFTVFSIVVQSPSGKLIKERLPLNAYLGIVAATNFKQRIRKMMEYYYADKNNFATTGTPNRLEYDQGFFVKLGDGAADIKPIAHLYKSQVYQLAEYLGVPKVICSRPPTTDTYSLEQGQDEFYFSLPYDKMDLCLYGKNNGYSTADVAKAVNLTAEQVERVYRDIDMKRSGTNYLHQPPALVEKVKEVAIN